MELSELKVLIGRFERAVKAESEIIGLWYELSDKVSGVSMEKPQNLQLSEENEALKREVKRLDAQADATRRSLEDSRAEAARLRGELDAIDKLKQAAEPWMRNCDFARPEDRAKCARHLSVTEHALIAAGEAGPAIKLVRLRTGWGLTESKALVDKYREAGSL